MAKSTFLKAQWNDLIMLNYEVDPAILEPYIPPYTELDLWEGRALVSMVGFMFNETKVAGIKWPFHVNFEEVNLRFYIKHFDGKQWKRGAVFVSEIVPKPIIVFIANNLYKEHYRALPMRHAVTSVDNNYTRYTYQWKLNKKWNILSAEVSNQFEEMHPDSAEAFIFEHYWGYNKLSPTKTMEYQVEHISWQVAQVQNPVFEADIAALYGDAFLPYLSKAPFSAFFAKGSDVVVRAGEKITFASAEDVVG